MTTTASNISAVEGVALTRIYGSGNTEVIAMEINDAAPRAARKRTLELLDYLGVGDRARNLPDALSGGQQQRVAVARTLANQPSLILADEPTAALDSHRGRQVMELFRQVAHEHSSAVIVVTHDHRSLDVLDRTYEMEDDDPVWACYHTSLYRFERGGKTFGVIGCAVGGPFAVLLAEQLFVSGCELLLSITSAGQIVPVRTPPYFVLIEKALRDEGTSHHYLPPSQYVSLLPEVGAHLRAALATFTPSLEHGAAWTTDAPYRETAEAIEFARAEGVLAVEMEAASLYAFAQAKRKSVVCFAHITNRMGVSEGDFEKGEADGTVASLRLIETVAQSWRDPSYECVIPNPTPTLL